MFKYKLIIEYEGTNFHGWQKQKKAVSVQDEIEKAFFKLTAKSIIVHGASRTDSGVHAFEQTAHVELDKQFNTKTIQEAINHHLKPRLISIINVTEENDIFHARFSSVKKQYLYKILNRLPFSPIEKNLSWHIKQPLDIQFMTTAAQYLIGTHDFSSFRASGCQANSKIRNIEKISIKKIGDHIDIQILGNAFLYKQVRIMVGTLVMFGKRKISPIYMKEILEKKDRRESYATAPPHGLYLEKLYY
ncbi:MAG: tRNA pseudouridine38-40 synthase [Candidatus Midichloriaceae bacterium]